MTVSDTGATPAALSTRDRRALWALLVSALLLRLAIIWMPGDPMFENGARPYEELLRGNATVDLMRGGLLPVLDYQVNHFSGGSLVISLLAMPVLFVCGPIFPALRLVSLLFSIPLVWIAFLLVDRWHGRRAAFVAASMLAFGPPGFLFLSCTVYGTHPEANMLAVALVYLYMAWRDGTRSPWRNACLGLVVGFALWFSYGLCIVLALLAVMEFAASGLVPSLRRLVSFVPGFLVGFSPWLAYMFTHPGRAFVIYENSITDHVGASSSYSGPARKFLWLFWKDGPDGLWMHGAFPSFGLFVARVLVAVYVVGVVYAGWNTRHEVKAFCLALIGRREGFRPTVRLVSFGFVMAWLTAYTITDFEVDWWTWVQGYRYLLPFWPFTAILFGIAVVDATKQLRSSAAGAATMDEGSSTVDDVAKHTQSSEAGAATKHTQSSAAGNPPQHTRSSAAVDETKRVSSSEVEGERGIARAPIVVAVLVCGVHLAGTLPQLRPDRLREHATASATSPRWHLRMLVKRFGTQPEMMEHVLRRALVVRTPEEQTFLSSGLAQGIAALAVKPSTNGYEENQRLAYEASIETLIREAPDPFRPVFEKALAAARAGAAPR